jgi:hypothetical protein
MLGIPRLLAMPLRPAMAETLSQDRPASAASTRSSSGYSVRHALTDRYAATDCDDRCCWPATGEAQHVPTAGSGLADAAIAIMQKGRPLATPLKPPIKAVALAPRGSDMKTIDVRRRGRSRGARRPSRREGRRPLGPTQKLVSFACGPPIRMPPIRMPPPCG